MAKHAHRFIETFGGFVGFGLNRASDEDALVYYLQKVSDDTLARTLVQRMTNDEQRDVFDMLCRLLKTHLSEDEYHQLFLKDR
jgi:hypothetical protein